MVTFQRNSPRLINADKVAPTDSTIVVWVGSSRKYGIKGTEPKMMNAPKVNNPFIIAELDDGLGIPISYCIIKSAMNFGFRSITSVSWAASCSLTPRLDRFANMVVRPLSGLASLSDISFN